MDFESAAQKPMRGPEEGVEIGADGMGVVDVGVGIAGVETEAAFDLFD